MAGFIKGIKVEKIETTALNTKVNKEVFDNFKVRCLQLRTPMNVVLETFMLQYTNDRFSLRDKDIMKWKKIDGELDTLNTTFNKEIYLDFKKTCKSSGYFVKNVIMAFMEQFANKEYVLECVEISEIKGTVKMVEIEDIEILSEERYMGDD